MKASTKNLAPGHGANAEWALAEALPQPAWLADAQGRVEYVNRQWISISGLSAAESRGRGWVNAIASDARSTVDTVCVDAFRIGKALQTECRIMTDGALRWHRLRLRPIVGESGVVEKWLGLWDDIDAERRAAESARFLERVNERLASLLDYQATGDVIARLGVPAIADCVLIDLFEEDGALRQAAVAHIDTDKEARLRAMGRACVGDCPVRQAIASGNPVVHSRAENWPQAIACEPESQDALGAVDAQSFMIIPLVAGARTLGAATFVACEPGRHYTRADLVLAQELAHRAALAIDRAIQYRAAQREIERRDAYEQALRESQEMFSKVFAASPDAICLTRLADGRLVDVNESFLAISGFARNEVIGKTTLELDIWPVPADRRDVVKLLAEQGQLQNREMVFRRKTGEDIFTLVSSQVLDLRGELHLLTVVREISERKRMEESLRKSAESFRSQYKSLPIPTYTWRWIGNDFVLDDFNDAAFEITRGEAPKLVGRSARAFFAGSPDVVEDMLQCMDQRSPVKRVGLFRQPSIGDNRYFHVTYVFVPPDLVLVYTEDVTARENAAARLQETLKELADAKFAIDQSAIVASSDAKGGITYANDKFCEVSGYAREELLGRNHSLLSSGVHSQSFFAELWATISAGRTWRGEICDRAKDGSLFWTDTTIVPYVDADGVPFQYTSIRYDITARKMAEEHVAFQAHLLGLIGEAVVATDKSNRILYWNPFAEKLHGWSFDEVKGRSLPELIARADDWSSTVTMLAKVLSGDAWAGEQVLKRRDGTTFLARVAMTPLSDKTGTVIGSVGVIGDITERRRIEEDVIKVQKLDSIGILAGGIAHDFNNLLTAILGNVALAKMYLRENDPSYPVLNEAEHAFQRARDLTQQLLTFASGGAPVRKPGSLVGLLTETPRFALTGSNVRCEFRIADDLWCVSFDAGQISQVLNNLVINAKQAMPSGGVITIQAENVRLVAGQVPSLTAGDYVKVSVKDQGEGILQEHIGKIFDPYFTTKQHGSGLGLATTYSIIKKHEGHITVTSRVPGGAEFQFYLPALPGGERSQANVTLSSAVAAPRVPPQEERPSLAMARQRVLIMDDEESIRRVASLLLTRLGYDVDQAEDGEEALALYRAARETGRSYSAVILDLTVPGGMGGEACIAQLRALDPGVKAIVSSGYSNDPIMAGYERYGFSAMVAKPYQLAELSFALEQAIGSGPR